VFLRNHTEFLGKNIRAYGESKVQQTTQTLNYVIRVTIKTIAIFKKMVTQIKMLPLNKEILEKIQEILSLKKIKENLLEEGVRRIMDTQLIYKEMHRVRRAM
jgi:hypothetical protein